MVRAAVGPGMVRAAVGPVMVRVAVGRVVGQVAVALVASVPLAVGNAESRIRNELGL